MRVSRLIEIQPRSEQCLVGDLELDVSNGNLICVLSKQDASGIGMRGLLRDSFVDLHLHTLSFSAPVDSAASTLP